MNTIIIEYEAEVNGCTPTLNISTTHNNSMKYDVVEHGTHTITQLINFSVIDKLRIKFANKVHSNSGETWLYIKKISIDGVDLGHTILEGKQWPQYDTQFHNTFNPPDFYQPGTKFFHNGVYELSIQLPIWKWYVNTVEQNA
jgi:hypothetical protein